MGDRLRARKPPRYFTEPLSLLPSVGQEMSAGQSAVMFCGWGVKAGWLIPSVDESVTEILSSCGVDPYSASLLQRPK